MQFLPTENGLYNGNYKVFSGFWTRALSVLIDILVITPVVLVSCFLLTWSITAELFGLVILSTLFFAYIIYFHYRFGATIGKMVLKIKVTNPNGTAISLKQAMLRSSVDIGFAALLVTAFFIGLSGANPQVYLALSWMERVEYLVPLYPSWYELVASRYLIWIFSEGFFLLINKRKRAIHDFIAGTVVINREFAGKGDQAGHLILTID